jgi:hypothetical protein
LYHSQPYLSIICKNILHRNIAILCPNSKNRFSKILGHNLTIHRLS